MREGRPRFLWGGSSPVCCRYSHATCIKQGGHTHTSLFSCSSCSPDQQRALPEPWERRGGVEQCLHTSFSAPFSPDLLRRLQCPAPVCQCLCRLLLCSAAAHAAPPSRLTHRQFGQSSSSSSRGGRGGCVCNQWWCNSRKATQVELQQQQLVVQLQQTSNADSD